MQPWGITIPFAESPLAEQRELTAALPGLGYTDAWSSEVAAWDAFTPLALASEWAPELRLGTAIAPAFTRGPGLLAQSAAALAVAAPGRFVLGIGTSSDVIVERWNGIPFERPYERVRDTVRFLRAALAGEKITRRYPSFAIDGFRLQLLPPVPPKILIAALRPGMLGLAGREADGAIINWLSAEDVARVVPYVHEGGPGKEIAARIFVVPNADPGAARAIGRQLIAAYLTVPVYRSFHEWLGRTDALTPLWTAWAAGDRRGAAASIPDAVVDELIVHGSPDECRAHIRRYVANGVTTPVIALAGVRDISAALRALSPLS